jgi:hypothetical protein
LGHFVTTALRASRYFPPFVINGTPLDLDHLEPLFLDCPTPEQSFELHINVRFSVHCFTVGAGGDPVDPTLLIMDYKTPRLFDQRRYDLSKNLPGIIRALPMVKVHQTPENRNYVYYSTLTELAGMEYRTFFSLNKARNRKHHLELFVESAYPSPTGTMPMRRRIRFSLLALKVYEGRPVRFAAR